MKVVIRLDEQEVAEIINNENGRDGRGRPQQQLFLAFPHADEVTTDMLLNVCTGTGCVWDAYKADSTAPAKRFKPVKKAGKGIKGRTSTDWAFQVNLQAVMSLLVWQALHAWVRNS